MSLLASLLLDDVDAVTADSTYLRELTDLSESASRAKN